jgi:glucan phosphoethanolaminetransferase (alkaline phosphatase superfamily)
VGYTLLAALFFYPLALSRKSLAICIPLLIFIGAANIFHAQFLGNMIDEFSLATLLRTEAHEAAEFLSSINRQMILVVLCWLVASFGCGYFSLKTARLEQLHFRNGRKEYCWA